MSAARKTFPQKPDSDEREIIAILSVVLKHRPQSLGIGLDAAGWTSVESLVAKLNSFRGDWRELTTQSIIEILSRYEPHRFECEAGKVRARYGHSLAEKILYPAAAPPAILFHATDETGAWGIVSEGLRCVTSRQYVHLSSEKKFATRARRCKFCQPIVFTVRAWEAHECDVKFYKTTTPLVWLADAVAPRFLDIETRSFRERVTACKERNGF